jgi:hypothetical protein
VGSLATARGGLCVYIIMIKFLSKIIEGKRENRNDIMFGGLVLWLIAWFIVAKILNALFA